MMPNTTCTHVYTAPAAIKKLREKSFDVVFLDHDLPRSADLVGVGDPGCGIDVANFLAQHPALAPQLVWIHSWNDEGRLKMANVLKKAGIPVIVQRFQYPQKV